MSVAEESTGAGGLAWDPPCITDCSILNQTSCQAVTRRQVVTPADQVSVSYWDLWSDTLIIIMIKV